MLTVGLTTPRYISRGRGTWKMRIDGRSVFGYFSDRQEAEEAYKMLSQAGFHDIALDEVSGTDQDARPDAWTNPLTGDFGSLSSLTLGADVGDDAGILLAADNSASGYGAGGAGPRGLSWMVVAVTDGSDVEVERAVKILKSHGAEV